MNIDELKSIRELVELAQDNLDFLRSCVVKDLLANDIDGEALFTLLSEDSPTVGVYDQARLIATHEVTDLYEKLCLNHVEGSEYSRSDADMWVRENITDEVIGDVIDVFKFEKEVQQTEAETKEEVDKFAEFLSSKEYDDLRILNLKKYEKELETETNVTRKRQLAWKISVLKERYSIGFMFLRVDDPKTSNKERDLIVELFFNGRRSEYMMERFKAKCKQFGLSEEVYKYLFNIEEVFLDKKYHVFNNLFLHSVMRYVSHLTAEEADAGKIIVQNLLNLQYHRFYSDEVEETFLNAIRGFLDRFEDYRQQFETNNILHPDHPYRIEKDKERFEELKKKISEDIKNHGKMTEYAVGRLQAINTTEELLRFYNKEKKKWEESPAGDAGEQDDHDTIEESPAINPDELKKEIIKDLRQYENLSKEGRIDELCNMTLDDLVKYHEKMTKNSVYGEQKNDDDPGNADSAPIGRGNTKPIIYTSANMEDDCNDGSPM